MKKITLGKTGLEVPAVAVGCMRIDNLSDAQCEKHLRTLIDKGLTFFDHADIYGGGECERKFARALSLTAGQREKLTIQSKCCIIPGVMYDASKEYILRSVDNILERLSTDYLDLLLLHRPDALTEPEEVAEAFNELEKAGKVRYFGVSNFRPGQIELLKTAVSQPLQVNQLQLSIPVSSMIAAEMEVNMTTDGAVDRDGEVLNYSRINSMTVQAWSPFQTANWQGPFIGSEKYPELNKALSEVGAKYGLTPTGAAAAWIARHPANIQIIAGSVNTDRVAEIADATGVCLERADWYRLYLAADHILP